MSIPAGYSDYKSYWAHYKSPQAGQFQCQLPDYASVTGLECGREAAVYLKASTVFPVLVST